MLIEYNNNNNNNNNNTPSIPKYSGLFRTIVALNQTRPSNRKAQFWISANQIANFEVSINPRNMYFKIMYIFFWFWGYFSFFGKRPISKKSTVFRNGGSRWWWSLVGQKHKPETETNRFIKSSASLCCACQADKKYGCLQSAKMINYISKGLLFSRKCKLKSDLFWKNNEPLTMTV